jgi:hypothetical protein
MGDKGRTINVFSMAAKLMQGELFVIRASYL